MVLLHRPCFENHRSSRGVFGLCIFDHLKKVLQIVGPTGQYSGPLRTRNEVLTPRSWLKLSLRDWGAFTMKGLLCFQSYVDKKAVLYLFYVGSVCVCRKISFTRHCGCTVPTTRGYSLELHVFLALFQPFSWNTFLSQRSVPGFANQNLPRLMTSFQGHCVCFELFLSGPVQLLEPLHWVALSGSDGGSVADVVSFLSPRCICRFSPPVPCLPLRMCLSCAESWEAMELHAVCRGTADGIWVRLWAAFPAEKWVEVSALT